MILFFRVLFAANDVRPYHAGRRGADPYNMKSKHHQQTK